MDLIKDKNEIFKYQNKLFLVGNRLCLIIAKQNLKNSYDQLVK